MIFRDLPIRAKDYYFCFFFSSLRARYRVTSKQWHYYSGILMGVQGTKKSVETLHEIFMGIFLFLSSSLSRHESEKHPNQMFWVEEAHRNGTCRPIFDLLGKVGIEKALPFQSQHFFFSSRHLVFLINWDTSASYRVSRIQNGYWQFQSVLEN